MKGDSDLKKIVMIMAFLILLGGCSLRDNSSERNDSSNSKTDNSTRLESSERSSQSNEIVESEEKADMSKLNIKIGDQTFSAELVDNSTAQTFKEKLPMTVKMDELNGNEKFYYLSETFPTNSERVGSIKNGDLMLYGSDCLVLFYKNFSTSYSYSRIASVDNPSGLARALGRRGVTVTFEMKE